MRHISACFPLQATFILFSICSLYQQHSKCACRDCVKVWAFFFVLIHIHVYEYDSQKTPAEAYVAFDCSSKEAGSNLNDY